MVLTLTRFVPFVRLGVMNAYQCRSIGILVRDGLAGDLFRLALFDSENHQGPV